MIHYNPSSLISPLHPFTPWQVPEMTVDLDMPDELASLKVKYGEDTMDREGAMQVIRCIVTLTESLYLYTYTYILHLLTFVLSLYHSITLSLYHSITLSLPHNIHTYPPINSILPCTVTLSRWAPMEPSPN